MGSLYLNARLKERVKSRSEMRKRKIPYVLPTHIKERYGDSDQMKFVDKNVIIPIGYVQHKFPCHKKKNINNYTPNGREEIHKTLKCVDAHTLHELMDKPDLSQTIEFNDNRLSLFCAQRGKCAITGTMLDLENMICLRKLPKHLGGNDKYKNLIIVTHDVSKLINATSQSSIQKYMDILKLNSKQVDKLNKLRKLADVENCLSTRQVK